MASPREGMEAIEMGDRFFGCGDAHLDAFFDSLSYVPLRAVSEPREDPFFILTEIEVMVEIGPGLLTMVEKGLSSSELHCAPAAALSKGNSMGQQIFEGDIAIDKGLKKIGEGKGDPFLACQDSPDFHEWQ